MTYFKLMYLLSYYTYYEKNCQGKDKERRNNN